MHNNAENLAISRPLTTAQLAELLQIPPRTLEDWRANDAGPRYWYAGKRVRYSQADVQEWIDFQRDQRTTNVVSA